LALAEQMKLDRPVFRNWYPWRWDDGSRGTYLKEL